MNSFEELEVWKQARNIRIVISDMTAKFPPNEKYRLTDQIIRSARSISANIAEGFGRFHHQENIQFCRIARGSLHETLDHLICAVDEGSINNEDYLKCKLLISDTLKILNGYILYLKRQKQHSIT